MSATTSGERAEPWYIYRIPELLMGKGRKDTDATTKSMAATCCRAVPAMTMRVPKRSLGFAPHTADRIP